MEPCRHVAVHRRFMVATTAAGAILIALAAAGCSSSSVPAGTTSPAHTSVTTAAAADGSTTISGDRIAVINGPAVVDMTTTTVTAIGVPATASAATP